MAKKLTFSQQKVNFLAITFQSVNRLISNFEYGKIWRIHGLFAKAVCWNKVVILGEKWLTWAIIYCNNSLAHSCKIKVNSCNANIHGCRMVWYGATQAFVRHMPISSLEYEYWTEHNIIPAPNLILVSGRCDGVQGPGSVSVRSKAWNEGPSEGS